MRSSARFLMTCVLAGGVVAVASATAPAAAPLEQFTAFAVSMGGIGAGRPHAGSVDIIIDRWSTDAERDQLTAALREGGSDALLKALQKIKNAAGRIRTAGSLGYPLQFARQIPLSGGGRRIIIATDRPISFLEATNPGPRSDYPFMVIDMRLDANNKGEGKLLPLAKITANDDHTIEIENYASEPVRLTEIRKLK